jgi:hypothetical protein
MGALVGLLLLPLLPVGPTATTPAAAQEASPSVAQLAHRGRQAGVPPDLLQNVRRRATRSGLSEAQTAGLLRPAVAMAEQGLPSAHVLRKALEGMAKQVPPGRVSGVLGRMRRHTAQAGQLIDPWLKRSDGARLVASEGASSGAASARDVLLENLAQSLMHDVPTQTVETFLDVLPKQVQQRSVPAAELGTAFGILADLPAARSAPDATARLVADALDAGFNQKELRRLPAAVRAARQTRGSAEAATQEAAAQIRNGTPASEVLNRLFRGGASGKGAAGTRRPALECRSSWRKRAAQWKGAAKRQRSARRQRAAR